jgi:hypothetical protein
MTRRLLSPALPVLAALIAFGPTGACAGEPSPNPATIDFAAGGVIRMQLNSGDMEIVGTSSDRITVSWRSSRASDERKVSIDLERRKTDEATLMVDGPSDRVRYRIEVPSRSDLKIDMDAGDLQIQGVVGSVRVQLLAGDLELRVGDPGLYREVRASVTAGSIDARPWQVEKDGLFRSLRISNSDGKYDLAVSLLAGQITLRAE